MNIDRARLQSLLQANLNHIADIRRRSIKVVEDAASQPENALIPIPFFGNLAQFENSTRRILTVGLNPSNREFQPGKRETKGWLKRFKFDPPINNTERLLQELSHYFQNNPYSWFNSFEQVLRGCDATYGMDSARKNIALHIDVCSPIATVPTWSELRNADEKQSKKLLAEKGKIFFLEMIDLFQPDIVIASVGKSHLEAIDPIFKPNNLWKVVYSKKTNKNGTPVESENPPKVIGCQLSLQGRQFFFANGAMRSGPFGVFTNEQKLHIGAQINASSERGN